MAQSAEAILSKRRKSSSAAPPVPVSYPTVETDPTDIGDDVVAILGQSNAVGIGENLDAAYFDPTDPRVFQFGGTVGTYLGKRVLASDPLLHQQQQAAPACVGFGVAFGRHYVKSVPANRSCLLVPCGRGSTGFADPAYSWDPAATPSALNLYLNARAQIAAALALNPKNRLVAVLWHQGEGDTNYLTQAQYAAKLDSVIADLRTTFALSDLPFIVGPMVPERVAGNINAGYPLINAAHIDTPRRMLNTWWFEGPTSSYNSAANGDTIHYNAAGQRILGYRYFRALAYAKANKRGSLPPVPQSLTLTQSGTSVVLKWAGGLGRTTDYVVQIDKGDGQGFVTQARAANLIDTTATITGLGLGSTIRAQVLAVNEEGFSSPSATATLVLATIPAGVTGLAAPAPAANRIPATWNAQNVGTGTATGYVLSYKRAIDGAYVDFPTVFPTPAGEITGLQTGTDYNVRVRARNAAGDGPNSAPITVTTTALAVLDADVGVALAEGWAMRRIVTGYAGSILTVRRSSDNATANIGLDANGNADEAAILTHIGASDGFVSQWWDQTGGGRHWIQATAALQPKIATAGVLRKANGVVTLQFTGTQYMTLASSLLYAAAAASVGMIARAAAAAVSQYVFAEDNGGVGGGTYSPLGYSSSGQPLFNDGTTARVATGVTVDGALQQVTSIDTGTAITLDVNGINRHTTSSYTPPTVTISTSTLGARRSGAANAFYTGDICEIATWTATLTGPQKTTLLANQRSYHGTPA